jgi:NitT/TauT family transport system substrate-binding protein
MVSAAIEFLAQFNITILRRFISVLLVFLFTVSACSPVPSAPQLTPITVQLSWLHQAQFAGLYAADQQGYFADEGLKVSFLEGGPNVDFIAPVADGRAQFGIAQPADLILARAAGKPVRSIAAIFQRSPIVFFALQKSGITRPQDFVGKKIRTAVTVDQTLLALMSRMGISPDQYETVNLPSDVKLFASGDVPVWGGYFNVLALEVQKAGYKINIISPDDYGIHFYGDVIIATDDLIRKNPDLALRFTRATLRGWQYAVEHPEELGSDVKKYYPGADVGLESAKMTTSIPLVNTGDNPIGWMNNETWDGMANTLRAENVLKGPVNVKDVYTLQFLEEIYSK